jgi:hypothetical protein
VNELSVYEDDVARYLTEGAQNQFTSLMQEFHLVASLCYKVKNLPRFTWNHNFTIVTIDGFPIAMKDLKAFPKCVLQEAERRLQVALQGLTFPDFDKVVNDCLEHEAVGNWIKDDLRNRDPGYSFISDTRNPFQSFSETLLRAMMDEDNNPRVASRFFVRSLDGKVHFKRGQSAFSPSFLCILIYCLGSMHDFFYQTGELLDAIFVLVKATQGGDTRGSEMTCHQIINTNAAPRAIYGISGYLGLVNFYSKTRQNTGSDKVLARFPAKEVMRLLLYYLVLLRPVEVSLAAELYDQETVELYSVNLWVRRGREMDTNMFTEVLRHFTDLYLHVPLAVSDWRQLVTNVFRNILHIDLDQVEEKESPADSLLDMFGRDEATVGRRFYGLEYSQLGPDFDETAFANWLRASIRLHNFQGLSVPPSAADPPMDQDPRLTQLMTRMEDALNPAIQEKKIQAFVQNQLPLQSIQDMINQALTQFTAKPCSDAAPIQPVISVHPQRLRVLRELYRNARVQFKSPQQAELFELVCQRSRHVIGILPTGGGKSLAIFGPPKSETGKSAVIRA